MEKKLGIKLSALFLISIAAFFTYKYTLIRKDIISGAPPYGEAEEEAPQLETYSWLINWKRPEGLAKVALQAGHWKNDELPEELFNLRGNSGSSGGGKSEWEVNYNLALGVARILSEEGINIEILPATVPPSYWADVFLAIHADGSTDRTKRGFKIASPWRDFSGKAEKLVANLEDTYQKETELEVDQNISRNMRGYYAFSWWRYEHAIHPMTVAAIIETGFLTNTKDRNLLIYSPQIPAQGIAQGVLNYLRDEGLVQK